MSKDLTAILLGPLGDPPPTDADKAVTPEWIETVVRKRGRPVIVRIAPLPSLKMIQLEVQDAADGMPLDDPELIVMLSSRTPATFVHVNHQATQAIVHGFDAGTAGQMFVGVPGAEFEEKLKARLGVDLEALHAADDQSRTGIGIVASRSAALLPGRSLGLPIGMPSALGTFAFHDRGTDHEAGTERCIFFGFDRPLVGALSAAPGKELARIIESSSAKDKSDPGQLEIVGALKALGDKPLASGDASARPTLLRAAEMLVLGSGRVFSCGDRASFWDERVLPLLSLGTSEPVIDADDLETLAESRSVLHALVEVVPSAAPPGGAGQVLEAIGDAELSPLLPTLASDGAYAGSILAFDPSRLLGKLRAIGGESLSEAVARIERVWYKAKTGEAPEGEAFQAFRKQLSETGQPDVDRVLRHLSELRIVLEVAAVNDLVVALAFYG